MDLVFFAAVFWILPIWLTQDMAVKRDRAHGWLWGLLLGWIGVVVLALLGSRDDPELSALEREVRVAELRRKLNGAE